MRGVWGILLGLALAWPAPAVADAGDLNLACRRWYGFAVGAYRTEDDWTQVGQPPWAPTVSPMFGGACSPAKSGFVQPFVGADSVPWYVFVRENGDPVRQLASASTGVYLGGDVLRTGLYASFGFPAVGGGASVLWIPDGADLDSRGNGLELRFNTYQVGSLGFQGMLVFTTIPRRKEG